MKKWFLLLAFIGTLVPTLFVIQEAGGWQHWQGVLPRGTTDSLYYYARIREVVDGHPLIGNPYAYEHRDALSPAFFLPDVVSAAPVVLGVPFNIAMLINMFVWSFAFLFLSFSLLQLARLPARWAAIWSALAYVGAYSFMLRPTVMQIVYPVFVIFLIALLKFLYEPLIRRRIIWLSLAAAFPFYVYSYLSYIVLVIFVFLSFWFLCTRRYSEFRALVSAGIGTAFLLIPFGIYTLMQMSGPYYLEMFRRIGLVYTHLPAIETYYYGRWVVLGLIVLGLLWRFFPRERVDDSERKVFWLASGAGLFVCLFLNVITGVELTLGVHIGRFVMPWMIFITGAALYEWYAARGAWPNRRIPYLVVSVLLLALIGGAVRDVSRGLDFFGFNTRGETVADVQAYATPLSWLDEHVPEQSVVWANESISQYLPIMTKQYVLFQLGAGLHALSDDELTDRYLLAHSLGTVTVEDLKRDFERYAGAGASNLQPLAQNHRAWLCRFFARFTDARDCSSYTDGITLRGEAYFDALEQRFKTIQKQRNTFLQQFHVAYLLVDRAHDDTEGISFAHPLYDDGRFSILPITALAGT